MVKVGDLFYRFKFDLENKNKPIARHTFKVTKVEKLKWDERIYIKCLEDSKIKLRDGYFYTSNMNLNTVIQGNGKCKYILLDEDNFKKAYDTLNAYYVGVIHECENKLDNLNKEFEIVNSLM